MKKEYFSTNAITAFIEEEDLNTSNISEWTPENHKVHEIYFKCKLKFFSCATFNSNTEHPPLPHGAFEFFAFT